MAVPIIQPPGNGIVPGTCGGSPVKNERGKEDLSWIQANQVRKYWAITSQMSLSTCAMVPAKIKKIAIANSATVSRSEASAMPTSRSGGPAARLACARPALRPVALIDRKRVNCHRGLPT